MSAPRSSARNRWKDVSEKSARLPQFFHNITHNSNEYFNLVNLQIVIIPLKLDPATQQGLQKRLVRNRSFVKTNVNVDPPELPQLFQGTPFPTSDIDQGEQAIERIVRNDESDEEASSHDGFVLLVTQPPSSPYRSRILSSSSSSNSIFKRHSSRTSFSGRHRSNPKHPRTHPSSFYASSDDIPPGTRPLLGAIVKVIRNSERSIIGCFCRRSIPDDAACELLRVLLTRVITEAFFFEENRDAGNEDTDDSSSPEHSMRPKSRLMGSLDQRFVSIESKDLSFFPHQTYNYFTNDLNLTDHWDPDIGAPTTSVHEYYGKCSCKKDVFHDGYYQYYTIKFNQFKRVIANPESFSSLIPKEPSKSVISFFDGQVQLAV